MTPDCLRHEPINGCMGKSIILEAASFKRSRLFESTAVIVDLVNQMLKIVASGFFGDP